MMQASLQTRPPACPNTMRAREDWKCRGVGFMKSSLHDPRQSGDGQACGDARLAVGSRFAGCPRAMCSHKVNTENRRHQMGIGTFVSAIAIQPGDRACDRRVLTRRLANQVFDGLLDHLFKIGAHGLAQHTQGMQASASRMDQSERAGRADARPAIVGELVRKTAKNEAE